MTTLALPGPVDAEVPVDPVFRFTVQQYQEMARAGILGPHDAVELLEGWLIRKMTKNPPHVVATALVAEALRRIVPAGWHVRSEGPLTTDDSVPEPDAAVALGSIRDYTERHPVPADLALAVEVADSSLDRDRRLKQRIYARAGVPTFWIVNLTDRRLEVYTRPLATSRWPKYENHESFDESGFVSVLLDDLNVGLISVSDLLP